MYLDQVKKNELKKKKGENAECLVSNPGDRRTPLAASSTPPGVSVFVKHC